MNICIDMRPALSRATGVGVYLENLVRGLSDLDRRNRYLLFSSSWKERFPRRDYGPNFQIHDRRFPVRALNYLWSRASVPSVETLLRQRVDVVHSPTPLVLPTRRAAKVTTVHDLYFLHRADDIVSLKPKRC